MRKCLERFIMIKRGSKEGQAREMLNLAFVIATDGDKSDIPLVDGKYVRTPYHKLTLENIEESE